METVLDWLEYRTSPEGSRRKRPLKQGLLLFVGPVVIVALLVEESYRKKVVGPG